MTDTIRVEFNDHVEQIHLPPGSYLQGDEQPLLTQLFPEAEWIAGLRDKETQVVYPLSLVTRDPGCLPRDHSYTIVPGKRPVKESEGVRETTTAATVETAEDGSIGTSTQSTIPKEEPASTVKDQLLKHGLRPALESDGDSMVCLLGIVRLPYAKLIQALGPPHSVVGQTLDAEDTDGKSDLSWTFWNESLKEPVTIYSGRDLVRSDGSIDWRIGGLMEHSRGSDYSLRGAPLALAMYLTEICGVQAWTYYMYAMQSLYM